jgi:hypothetical protein
MTNTEIPNAMPVLSWGGHSDPQQGACFMEYTSLLAGLPFSDTPACVDNELTTMMVWINDSLVDADRHLLVPLLGRGIGLVHPGRPAPKDATLESNQEWYIKSRQFRRYAVIPKLITPYNGVVQDLHGTVAVLFSEWCGATGNMIIDAEDGVHEYCEQEECTHHLDPGHRAAVAHMISLAEAAHTAYEEAMAEMGWEIKREVACELPQVMEIVAQK